jgi:hypothetical protein
MNIHTGDFGWGRVSIQDIQATLSTHTGHTFTDSGSELAHIASRDVVVEVGDGDGALVKLGPEAR